MIKHNKILDENIAFFEGWASNYDFSLFQFWMKKFHAPVLKEITNKRIRILDLSCGSGELLREISNNFPLVELYGIDISPKMLEIARGKLQGRGVILQKMDVCDLKYADNYFDFVFSTEALHHYYDQTKALQEMRRVVKKGGKVIVVDINFGLRIVHRIFEKVEPGCVKVNSKEEMRNLFVESGLKIVWQKRNFLFSVATMGVKDTN